MSVEPDLSAVEQRLLHRLEFELEERLFLVAAYTPAERRLLHLTGAAEQAHPQLATNAAEELNQIVEFVRQAPQHGTPSSLGTHRCSLHLYSEWLLLHFRQDRAGLVVGIDPQSATNLRSFLEDIRPVVSRLLTDSTET